MAATTEKRIEASQDPSAASRRTAPALNLPVAGGLAKIEQRGSMNARVASDGQNPSTQGAEDGARASALERVEKQQPVRLYSKKRRKRYL